MTDQFVKTSTGRPVAGFFATEAAGLDWIRVPGGPPVPRVHEVGPAEIRMDQVSSGSSTPAMARQFGRRLATLHDSGAPSFGSPPPAAPGPRGWIGRLPMAYTHRAQFAEFWALDRLAFTARLARDRGALSSRQATEVDSFVEDLLAGEVDTGPPEEPARLHGDLWSGNVLWGADGHVWLIDPAAHGGHRESDLAMLALFGVAHLEALIDGYREAEALAPGWQSRVPLHQTWPLLVHAALFGGGYAHNAVAAMRAARRQ